MTNEKIAKLFNEKVMQFRRVRAEYPVACKGNQTIIDGVRTVKRYDKETVELTRAIYGDEIALVCEKTQKEVLELLASVLQCNERRFKVHYFKSHLNCGLDVYLSSVYYRAFMAVFLYDPEVVEDFIGYLFSGLGRKIIERDVRQMTAPCATANYDSGCIVAKIA